MNTEKMINYVKKYSLVWLVIFILIALTLTALTLTACNRKDKTDLITNIKNDNSSNGSLNQDIEGEKECVSDKDCVHLPVCCHRNAMPCVPKYKVNENTLNRCTDVFCTRECRECTICRCVNNKCIAEPIEGSCC